MGYSRRYWQNGKNGYEKMSFKCFYIYSFSKKQAFYRHRTVTEAKIEKNGNISFAFIGVPIIRSEQKTVKVNKCVTN